MALMTWIVLSIFKINLIWQFVFQGVLQQAYGKLADGLSRQRGRVGKKGKYFVLAFILAVHYSQNCQILSKKYLKQISDLGINVLKCLKNKGTYFASTFSTFEIDVSKLPFFIFSN